MALQIEKPQTFQLKVATAKVKKQVKDGPLFFILPPLLVVAVILFCYIAPAPVNAAGGAKVSAVPETTEEESGIAGIVIEEAEGATPEDTYTQEDITPMADGEYIDFEEEEEEEETAPDAEEIDEEETGAEEDASADI